jgi:hypothetical protein
VLSKVFGGGLQGAHAPIVAQAARAGISACSANWPA